MQKIHINNFGPILNAAVEIKQMVVFIGEQASGKSTISKLIYFFKSLKEDLFTLIFNNLGITEDIRILFIKEIQIKFYKFFGSTKHLPNFKITYFYNENKTLELTLASNSIHPVKYNLRSPSVRGSFVVKKKWNQPSSTADGGQPKKCFRR